MVERALKRLEMQGYCTLANQGAMISGVDGEDWKKSMIKDYGNPLTYIAQYVSHRNPLIMTQ